MDIGVSIVLGSYNRKRFLQKAIESIRNNNIKRPFEIIVIDGGSTDGSIEYLTRQKDIVTIIQHNHGRWRGKKVVRKSWGYFMNLGFKCSKGKYVCMVSDDCLLPQNLVENGISEIEKQSKRGEKIGGLAFYFRDWPNEVKYKLHYTFGDYLAINHGIYVKEALEDVGYVDEESFQFYSADGDLSLRIWQKGYKIIKSEKCFIEHHAHAPARLTHSGKEQYYKDIAMSKKKWNQLIAETNKLGRWEYKEILDVDNTVKNFPRASTKEIIKSYVHVIKEKIKRYYVNFKEI